MSVLNWWRSRRCEHAECVEVAEIPGVPGTSVESTYLIRNSKDAGKVVWFNRQTWEEFIEAVKNGDFDTNPTIGDDE